MKRQRVLLAALLVLFSFTISAQAIEPRIGSAAPSLSFDGTTAHCYANYVAGNRSDELTATLTLYQNTSIIDSWTSCGKGRFSVSGKCTVEKGKTYKLVLTYSVNGADKPSTSVSSTCR